MADREYRIRVKIDSSKAKSGGGESVAALGGIRGAAVTAAAALGTVTVGFAAMAVAARAVGSIIGRASTEFASFDQAMRNVGAVSGATREEIAALTDEALRLSSATRFAPEQTAQALYALGSSGQKAREQLESLPAVLDFAEAAQADLAISTELVVSGLKAFGLQASESRRVADVFTASVGLSAFTAERLQLAMRNAGPSAAAFGQSLEGTVASSAALVDVMLSGERAGSALRSVFNELNDKGAELGIAVRDAEGNFRPLVDIIGEMEAAGWDAGRAVAEFGAEAGPGLAVLLQRGSEGLRELEKGLQSSDQAATRAAEQLDTLQGDLDQFASKQDEAWKVLGAQFEDGSRLLVQTLTAALDQMVSLVKDNGETISRSWLVAVQAMIGAAEVLSLAIARLADDFRMVVDAIGGFAKVMPPAFQQFLIMSVAANAQMRELRDGAGESEVATKAFFDELRAGAEAAANAIDQLGRVSDLDIVGELKALGIEATNLRDLDQLTAIIDQLEAKSKEAAGTVGGFGGNLTGTAGDADNLTGSLKKLADGLEQLTPVDVALLIEQNRIASIEAKVKTTLDESAMRQTLAEMESALADSTEDQLGTRAKAVRDQIIAEGRLRLAAEEEYAQKVSAIQNQAWSNIQDIAAGAISDILKTGEVDMKALAESILDIFANMLAELLVEWAINAAKRIALEKAVSAASGGGGGGGGISAGSVSSIAGGGGGGGGSYGGISSSAASSAVAVLAVVAIVYGIGYAMGWWGNAGPTRGQTTFGGGPDGDLTILGSTGENAGVTTKHVRAAFDKIIDFLQDTQLEIERFNEILVSKVEDTYQIVGDRLVNLPTSLFSSEEIDEAIAVMAIQAADFGDSVSDFLAAVIHGSKAITMEQLNAEIELARMVEDFGKTDLDKKIHAIGFEMNRIFDGIANLLGDNLEQLGVGLNQVVNEELGRWQQIFNELTGVELTPAERLNMMKAQAQVFNAEKALRIADLQGRLANLRAEQSLVNARLKLGFDELHGKGRLMSVELGLQGAYMNASKEILDAGLTALGLQIKAIEALLDGLNAIPDIDLSKIRLPGGGGGISEAAQDMERLQQLLDAAAVLGLNDVAAAIAAVNKKWDEARLLARGNAEALDEIAAAREAEINAIRDGVRQTYYDAIAQAQGLSEIWGVLDRFRDLRDSILDAGLSAEETAERMRGIDWAEDVELQKIEMGIVDRLFGYLQGEEAWAAQSLEFARMKVELEFGIMKAQLQLLGVFEEYIDIFNAARDAALKDLEVPDIEPPARRVRDHFEDTARAAQEIAESFARAKQSVAEFLNEVLVGAHGGTSPVGGVLEAQRQLDEVIRQAMTGNIGAIENFDDYASTLLRLARDAYGSSPEFQAIRDYVLASGADILGLQQGREGNLVFDERFHQVAESQLSEQKRMADLLARIERELSRRGGSIVNGQAA